MNEGFIYYQMNDAGTISKKRILLFLLILWGGMSVSAQEKNAFPEIEPEILQKSDFPGKISKPQIEEISFHQRKIDFDFLTDEESLETEPEPEFLLPGKPVTEADPAGQLKKELKIFTSEVENLTSEAENRERPVDPFRLKSPDFAEFRQNHYREKFHWKPALIESGIFLAIQHSLRMVQKKTRRELDGEFFRDWGISARNLHGWRDGDSAFTNYVAHPMQGAVTGRIFLNNSDRAKGAEFGKSKKYWETRFKAMLWSALWSTQFEIGPISEASIGNVGLYDRVGPNRMGWVDIVITPTAGTGVLIGEDMIDKYILKKWIEKGSSRTRIKIFRTFFTPFQSFTNVLAGKVPWKRDDR